MAGRLMQVRGVTYHVRVDGNPRNRPLLLLHGFTGSQASWQEVTSDLCRDFFVVRIDLLGHGQSDAPLQTARYEMNEVTADLVTIMDDLLLQDCACIGYSMGGRVALALATVAPHLVTQLLLESASPGLQTADERESRQKQDDVLANWILAEGVPMFVAMWEKLPLFATKSGVPPHRLQVERDIRLAQCAHGLAASLRGMGTGVQPSQWDALYRLSMPVCLLTGTLDEKFTNIANQMVELIPHAKHVRMQAAGHTVHMEQPAAYCLAVRDFLREGENP